MLKRRSFLRRFQELIEKEGHTDITKFVNDWIDGGGTFKTIQEWILLKGLDFDYTTIWTSLRKYLTTPYDATSAFWNKWNSIAQIKGFDSIEKLMEVYKKKYTNTEMAIELGVTPRTIEFLRIRLDGNRNLPLKDQPRIKRKSQRDEDGFTKTDIKEKWNKILTERGFQNLREAADYYIKNKMPPSKMAEDLGVTERALKIRLEKAGVILPKEEKMTKGLNPLGLI